MPDVFGVIDKDSVKLGNCVGGLVLAIQTRRKIGARRPEIRRQFKRTAQQVFSVLIPPDPPGQFGHHADRGNVERVRFQMRAEQWLGVGQPIVVKRKRGVHQTRIVDPALDRLIENARGRQEQRRP